MEASITETVFEPELATYSVFVVGLTDTADGELPESIIANILSVDPSSPEIVLEMRLVLNIPSSTPAYPHKNDNFYDMGKLIADIVKQTPHHLDQLYKQSSSNYTLIQATKWFISTPSSEIGRGESSQQQQESIDIQFNISSLLKSQGVYTIVVYLKQNNYDTIPATSYSIFSP